MNKLFILLILIAFSFAELAVAQEFQFNTDDIDIPHTAYTLPNGLRLVVHEDHKAPIAAVNVWYHVGSKDEKPGKSGFAHLFEHLMFNGSENYNDDYFQALERIGGTDLNGTTNNDRTNYFQNVPTAALDQVLFLESDRMGHLLGAIDQDRLDEQRGVVQNEKRQGENQPYGIQYDLITKAMFPKGHPYSWTVIGEMEDLNAASLEDVHEWFKTYYGPDNAVVVVAGDVEAEDIYQRVLKYFGDIPAGPTLARHKVSIVDKPYDTRQVYQDRVPETRIVQVWNTPQFGSREDAHFDLISSILTTGKNSRLYKRLVYEDQIASSVTSFQWSKEITGNFLIQANVKPGQSQDQVENTLLEVMNEFLENGPTEQELKRAKASYFSGFIKGMERIGGFGGKSDILARSAVYFDNPDYYKVQLQHVSETTIEDLKATANKWLTKGKHTLICNPFPDYSAATSEVDRTELPELGTPKSSSFPDLQQTTLDNGMRVVLAQRAGVPTVVINMLVDAGYASDQFATPGTASLAMNMMDEGTKNFTSLEINEKLQLLGASLNSGSDLDHSFVNMTTLKPSLDNSLEIFAEVVLNPGFPESEFDRLKKEQLVKIQREKSQPIQMAIRVIPQYLYGQGHAYSLPLTGSGYENTVSELTRDDVLKFYSQWMKPNNSTLVVVGDVDMDYLTGKLEELFGKWKSGEVPQKNLAEVKTAQKNTLYLMDRPDSEQSVILAGHLTNPYGNVSEIARESMVEVLGGQFTSRINMNLREDKHWSYGAGGFVLNAKGQRPFLVYAPVQTDKTSESVNELINEVTQYVGDQPITAEELEKVNTNKVLGLPGKWETNGSVAGSINSMVKYNLPDDYYQTYDQEVRNLTLDKVRETGTTMIHPSEFNWFIVGDKAKIMEGLEGIGFDEIVEIDADGKPLGLGGKIEVE